MANALLIILVVIIFAVVSLSAYFYLEKTKKRRLKKIKTQSGLSPEDEAYNRVKRTEGATRMMKRKGKDVQQADEKVNKAEQALEKGDLSQAKDLAAKAKDDLADEKTDMEPSNDDEDVKRAYTVDELEEVEFKESEEANRKRRELEEQKKKLESLPDNFLESKFEMKLARDLLNETEHGQKAEELYAKAEKCFDEEDYTGALRYSIKCKKNIKGKEGAGLISGQDIDKKEGPPEKVKERFPDLVGGSEKSKDAFEKTKSKMQAEISDETEDEDYRPIEEEEKSEVVKTCPECGFEGGEDDSYCPKCGAELIIEKSACPECGQEVEEGDEFCRNCGTLLEESTFVCPECSVEVGEEDEFCPNCGIEFE
ncbi:MAG: zinc ribbon domain-containing protein [Candidatus Thermoplasmatota archaeon]